MRKMALSSLRLKATDLDEWRAFAVDGLDFEVVDGPDANALYLRIDDRPWRFVVEKAEAPGLACAAWELPSPQSFRQLGDDLRAAGVTVREGTKQECDDRRVEAMIACSDPAGIPLEFVLSPKLEQRPVHNHDGTRFVTGEFGCGHLVIGASDIDASTHFYHEVLGFHMRDSMAVHHSAVPGRTAEQGPAWIRFFGCNPRHHSLALFDAPIPGHLVHIMVETDTLDSVGIALDRVLGRKDTISATLGRHTNDHMVSFYVRSPSGFDVEFGTGARTVDDPDNWTTTEITAVSFWGHKFGNIYDH